jgi:hypothetical protein
VLFRSGASTSTSTFIVTETDDEYCDETTTTSKVTVTTTANGSTYTSTYYTTYTTTAGGHDDEEEECDDVTLTTAHVTVTSTVDGVPVTTTYYETRTVPNPGNGGITNPGDLFTDCDEVTVTYTVTEGGVAKVTTTAVPAEDVTVQYHTDATTTYYTTIVNQYDSDEDCPPATVGGSDSSSVFDSIFGGNSDECDSSCECDEDDDDDSFLGWLFGDDDDEEDCDASCTCDDEDEGEEDCPPTTVLEVSTEGQKQATVAAASTAIQTYSQSQATPEVIAQANNGNKVFGNGFMVGIATIVAVLFL